jgi:hypothetical protein
VEAVNIMAKYDPLQKYLEELPDDKREITLTFQLIEKIIGSQLPFSAYEHRAWWSNEEHGVHVSALAWMRAGWRVDGVNQKERWVRFIRQRNIKLEKTKRFTNKPNLTINEKKQRTTEFSANRPVKTLVIHKPDCRVIPWEGLKSCGCGDRGELGNQRWYCETHITRKAVDEFMHNRFWAILLCDLCFGEE